MEDRIIEIGDRLKWGDMANPDRNGTVCEVEKIMMTVVFDDNHITKVPKSIINGHSWRWIEGKKSKEETINLYEQARMAQEQNIQQAKQERELQRAEKEERVAANKAKQPGWAKAVIVAELQEDTTDSQSDYFGHRVNRTVLLAWSKHTRDLFPEMRKAAMNFDKTQHISKDGIEHREKWSGGGGYYLSESDYSHDSGWVIRKHDLKYFDLDGEYQIPDVPEKNRNNKHAKLQDTIKSNVNSGLDIFVINKETGEKTTLINSNLSKVLIDTKLMLNRAEAYIEANLDDLGDRDKLHNYITGLIDSLNTLESQVNQLLDGKLASNKQELLLQRLTNVLRTRADYITSLLPQMERNIEADQHAKKVMS